MLGRLDKRLAILKLRRGAILPNMLRVLELGIRHVGDEWCAIVGQAWVARHPHSRRHERRGCGTSLPSPRRL
jgi:hypothetical protein